VHGGHVELGGNELRDERTADEWAADRVGVVRGQPAGEGAGERGQAPGLQEEGVEVEPEVAVVP